MKRRVLSSLEPIISSAKPVQITRAGTFTDPRYGEFAITPTMLATMVQNFDARTYGQDIFIDVAHNPDAGAAGTMQRLWVDGDALLASVEWTAYGRQAISERGYKYLSAEYFEDYTDNEQRRNHGPLLAGAGLTLRPVIKHLSPVQLSETSPALLGAVLTDLRKGYLMNKHLEGLKKALAESGLAAEATAGLLDAYQQAAKTLGDDDAALAALAQQIAATGKQLADSLGGRPAVIQLTLQAPTGTKSLGEDDIKRILSAERTAEEQRMKSLAETIAAKRKTFTDLLNADEGLKSLSESERTLLHKAAGFIGSETTAEQVTALAQQQIALGHQLGIDAQLAKLGRTRMIGSTRISLGDDRSALQLQTEIDRRLRESPSFGTSHLRCTEDAKLKPGVRRILAEFDRNHARQLAEEARCLADGGATTVSSFTVPSGFQRTVIREALSDLNILDLVQMSSDPGAQATTQIPYETRLPGTIVNNGIVYEGAGIPKASIRQDMDTAYVNAMKISMKISNEVMHFSQYSLIDWDAYARNVASNARLMQELVARRIANEMQRSADAYQAVAQTATSISAQLTGSNSLIKTANWPIIRPLQLRDLKGTAIGSAQNPITVVVNNTTLSEYDGSGTQSAGTYWTLENANLGFVRLVNQAGVAQTPTASTTCTIAYSYAANVSKFDIKLPASTTIEDHLNGALRAVGARKAVMNSDRFVLPNFALMSPVLNDMLSNASQFTYMGQRSGSSLDGGGDLVAIKSIPSYGTNAPNVDLGDERLILGERGTLSYVVVKPFVTGQPFEAVDSNGLPIGEKVAYGEEYNAIWCPTPVRYKFSSVIVYDSDARTAAA